MDKTVVHVIRLASFLRICFQSACPLMPSLSAYCLVWVSLTWTWVISSQQLQQSAALLLTLDVGYLLMALDLGYLL